MADEAKAKRDEVLGWMQRTGHGYTIAAGHFGIKPDTVKAWVRRYVKTAPPARTGTPAEIVKHLDDSRPIDGRSALGGGNPRVPDPLDPRARPLSAADFPADDRGRLRGAVRRLLEKLDSDEYVEDPKKADAASRALMNLLKSCPDILTFEERTNGLDNDGAAGREDAARRVSRALDPDSTDGPEDGG